MTGEIQSPAMPEPETIEEALAVYRAIQRLELVLVVNGVTTRFPIKFTKDDAAIVATINT